MRKSEKLIIAIKEIEYRLVDLKSTPTMTPKIFQGRIEAIEYGIKVLQDKLKELETTNSDESKGKT
jgi:hypothetical protein